MAIEGVGQMNKREMKKELKRLLGWALQYPDLAPLDESINSIPTRTEASERRLQEVRQELVAELLGFEKFDSVGMRREMRQRRREFGLK